MLEKQESLPLSPYSNLYDLIIEKDNELRRINELIDFSFIYKELEDNYCLTNGRNAICPVRMFKYLLLKRMYKLSDRDVVKRSKYDMYFKYFLDMAPEDPVIDPSSLTQFRKLRLKNINLLDLLIQKTIELAVEHDLIDVKATLIVDSTHSHSRHRSRSAAQYLNEHAKAVRKATYEFDESLKEKYPEKPTDKHDVKVSMAYCEKLIEVVEKEDVRNIPDVQKKLNYLKELVEDCQETTEYSADRDARTGHKSEDTSFFGYKTHLAISEERLIVAAEVTSGDKSDGKYLRNLVEKSEKAGLTVETVIGDTAYSEKDNIQYAKTEEFQLVSKLNPQITQGGRAKEDEFEFNKDAGLYVCKAGHMAIRKARTGKKEQGKNQKDTYYFDIKKCAVCPFRDGCYKEGAKSKTYSVSIKSTEHKEQEAFQNSEEFREHARSRYKIEAKNSELKHRHGYETATSAGLFGMEIQGATAIFAVNLKRILKLLNEKE